MSVVKEASSSTTRFFVLHSNAPPKRQVMQRVQGKGWESKSACEGALATLEVAIARYEDEAAHGPRRGVPLARALRSYSQRSGASNEEAAYLGNLERMASSFESIMNDKGEPSPSVSLVLRLVLRHRVAAALASAFARWRPHRRQRLARAAVIAKRLAAHRAFCRWASNAARVSVRLGAVATATTRLGRLDRRRRRAATTHAFTAWAGWAGTRRLLDRQRAILTLDAIFAPRRRERLRTVFARLQPPRGKKRAPPTSSVITIALLLVVIKLQVSSSSN